MEHVILELSDIAGRWIDAVTFDDLENEKSLLPNPNDEHVAPLSVRILEPRLIIVGNGVNKYKKVDLWTINVNVGGVQYVAWAVYDTNVLVSDLYPCR